MSADELAIAIPEEIPDDACTRLAAATVEVFGRMPNASNATFLARLADADGRAGLAIYKPARGERPLWDFPSGLYKREVAAFALSELAGWHVVPPTVLRHDAPLGPGSLQWFVNADFREHYFSVHEQLPALHERLRAIAAFDIVANNTDRKSGHCLLERRATHPDGPQIWAIDNGLCFSTHAALRTVIWDFAHEPLSADVIDAVRRIADAADALDDLLTPLLDGDEIAAIVERAAALAARGTFPDDPSGRGYPWPLV